MVLGCCSLQGRQQMHPSSKLHPKSCHHPHDLHLPTANAVQRVLPTAKPMRACQIAAWSIALTANRDRWDGRQPITQNFGVRSSAEVCSDDWEHWSRDSASNRWLDCPTKKNFCRENSIPTKIAIDWEALWLKFVIKGGAGKQQEIAIFAGHKKLCFQIFVGSFHCFSGFGSLQSSVWDQNGSVSPEPAVLREASTRLRRRSLGQRLEILQQIWVRPESVRRRMFLNFNSQSCRRRLLSIRSHARKMPRQQIRWSPFFGLFDPR